MVYTKAKEDSKEAAQSEIEVKVKLGVKAKFLGLAHRAMGIWAVHFQNAREMRVK